MARDLVAQTTPHSILEFESPSQALIETPVRRSSRHVTWIVSAMVISLLVVSATFPIDKVVTATGRVSSTEREIVMQPLDVSIVRTINVQVGQVVHTGDVLATLDPTLAAADVSNLQAQVANLAPEVERLRDESAGRPYAAHNPSDPYQALQQSAYEQRHAQYTALMSADTQKINSLEAQIAGNLSQATYYRQRLSLASGVEDMRKQLEQMQVGSKLNTLAAIDTRVEMERSMSQAQAAADSEKQDLGAAIAQRDQDKQNWFAQVSQSIHDEGGKLDDARAQLEKAQLHKKLVEMRAPSDAIVLNIEKLSIGSVLQVGEQFMTLVPLDAPLEIEAFVSGDDAGFVHEGDPVEIKFNTFNYAIYGDAIGKVRLVSADSFVQPQGAATSSGGGDPSTTQSQAQSSMPGTGVFYRDYVTLEKLRLRNTPEGFRLVPGLNVTADINVGKRTVADYLLGRFLPAMQEGMREP